MTAVRGVNAHGGLVHVESGRINHYADPHSLMTTLCGRRWVAFAGNTRYGGRPMCSVCAARTSA